MLLLNYKKFLDKHAERVGAAGNIIPLIYWLFVWIDFSAFNFLFIFLLPLTTFFWIWTIIEEFAIRKKHPEQKSFFFLILPIAYLLFSTASTIHIYYR